MRNVKKTFSFILIILLILQYGALSPVYAAVVQPSPEGLTVAKDAAGNPLIGFDENQYGENGAPIGQKRQCFAELTGKALTAPSTAYSGLFLNYYLQEVNKPYKLAKAVEEKESDVEAKTDANNDIRLTGLSSGTVYYAYSRAYYTYTRDTSILTSDLSKMSNVVRFMTDIDISASPYGPNQIKIVWDDVWDVGKRMEYKLYISESEDFTNTEPIYINQNWITNGSVKVNQNDGTLEYIYTVNDPGKVYYIKIAPNTMDSSLFKSKESYAPNPVSSYILAKTTKVSATEDGGAIWKLEWSPVIPWSSNYSVSYKIYRSRTGDPQFFRSTSGTSCLIPVSPGEEDYYYIIYAIVTENGELVYPEDFIRSQEIRIKESEVPATPASPVLVEGFPYAGNGGIYYDKELTSTSATLLWELPLRGDGEEDTNIEYDIWLLTDPNQLSDPPAGTRIASSVKMNESNYVKSGTRRIGYKYKIDGLLPNSTYYFKIVAKKSFVEIVDNVVTNVTLQSDYAMKIIMTPAAGPTDQPVAPNKPPFLLKTDVQGKDMVTSTSAIVTLKNKWYERFNITESGRYSWIYTTPGAINAEGLRLSPPVPDLASAIENGTADPMKYRKVEYDNTVTIDVGCVEYTPDFNYDSLKELSADKLIDVPVTPNDPAEVINAPGAIKDGKKHNVDIAVNDLEPNTTYIIWIRAVRKGVNLITGETVDLISEPSDPLIVTTVPDFPMTVEEPTVPVFNYSQAGDVYVDLGWNFNNKYVYHIKYATADDISKAEGTKDITPDMLKYATYYRISGLKPDTVYYFWIWAEMTDSRGNVHASDVSDSLVVKTKKDIPPDTPNGFGVKGTPGSITKDSITYEWILQEGMDYILEISGNIDYKDSKKYTVTGASEFTVTGLRSNYRYYARLYAYDPDKKLESEPTQSVTVRTLRSSNDYDSSEDVEDVISGDYIVIDDEAVNGIWSIQIVGVNADRFIEHVRTDNVLDYCIKLTDTPAGTKTISVVVSQRVFKALGNLGENLMLKTVRNTVIIRPGVLADSNGVYGSLKGEANFVIDITLDSPYADSNTKNLILKSPVSELEVGISDGITAPLVSFSMPLKLVYQYDSAAWYKPGVTSGYVLPSGSSEWVKSVSTGSFDPDANIGTLSFDTLLPGRIAVADQGTNYYDDISGSYAKSSIISVASTHKLKSISGRKFEPSKTLTVGDAAKFMLDVLDTNYGSDYMSLAVKAGIVQSADVGNASANCTREKLIGMAMRVCELKTSQKAKGTSPESTSVYKDIGQASSALLPKIRFAQENGIITSRFSDTLGPKDPVTRAEAMVLLEKLLRYAGEI
ncbi:MAG TPA: S-layer homology domain-containing protein [Clostridia bacterium]|nr:S-layer homology domain-containing protein [Clostridia bacterium]